MMFHLRNEIILKLVLDRGPDHGMMRIWKRHGPEQRGEAGHDVPPLQ